MMPDRVVSLFGLRGEISDARLLLSTNTPLVGFTA